MTEEEKLIKHIDMLIYAFNEVYKDYKREENLITKAVLRKMLMNYTFGIAKEFNELKKILCEVES